MIELRILGQIALGGVDARLASSVLQQPKRLALLAYLACERRPVARDTLLGIFWPDASEGSARSALRKALHFLRQKLGGEAILGHGNHMVGLNATAVSTDVWTFFDALSTADPGRAVATYQGTLLPGLFVEGAPELDRWLEGKRMRLQLDALEASLRLAETTAAAGKVEQALFWARRAEAIRPSDEQGLRLALTLLDRLGKRSGALLHFEAFRKRMWADLGVPPSPETLELVHAIRTRTQPHAIEAGQPTDGAPQPPTTGPGRRLPEGRAFHELAADRLRMAARTDAGVLLLRMEADAGDGGTEGEAAAALRAATRGSDLVGRSDERTLVVLALCESVDAATICARRICERMHAVRAADADISTIGAAYFRSVQEWRLERMLAAASAYDPESELTAQPDDGETRHERRARAGGNTPH